MKTTYMLHLQQQRDVDLARQKLLLYIGPSYGCHINEGALRKGSQQSIYSQCMSGRKKLVSTYQYSTKVCRY